MSIYMETDARVTAEAARWFGALLHGNERSPEFFAWLEESPRNVEELLFVMADAQDLALLTDDQRMRIEKLSRELGTDGQAGSNVVPVFPPAVAGGACSEARPAPPRPSEESLLFPKASLSARSRWAAGLAAAVLLSVAAVWLWSSRDDWKTYSTDVGEQRALTLADGSVIHLNTDSGVQVRLGETSRSVRLVRGEAMFTVEHDASRPFLVYASNAVIQAIGTQFVVHRQAGGTRVAVIEGLVQVSEDRAGDNEPRQRSASDASPPVPTIDTPELHFLAAGEAAEVANEGGVSAAEAVDTERATAWRQRRLVFEEDSLGTIASEFNRYNATIKIRVEGVAAEELFSGTFDADDPEAMVQALGTGDPRLLVAKSGKEIVIRKR